MSETDNDKLREKELTVVGGNAGALEFVRQLKIAVPPEHYERWLDHFIEDGSVGTLLYSRRWKYAARINAEACL